MEEPVEPKLNKIPQEVKDYFDRVMLGEYDQADIIDHLIKRANILNSKKVMLDKDIDGLKNI